jgi:hypothetical protein
MTGHLQEGKNRRTERWKGRGDKEQVQTKIQARGKEE